MDYWNSDGSIAEMCGNGVRVFARYLVASGLATPGPARPADRHPGRRRGRAARGRRDQGPHANPRVYAASTATVGPLTFPGVAVDCGNPHLVCALHDGLGLAVAGPDRRARLRPGAVHRPG